MAKNNIKTSDFLLKNLREIIPNPKSELEFGNTFELLVAVMLSAQCTDKRVNIVTRELFKKYKTPSDFATLEYIELEEMIKSLIDADAPILPFGNVQVPNNKVEYFGYSMVLSHAERDAKRKIINPSCKQIFKKKNISD